MAETPGTTPDVFRTPWFFTEERKRNWCVFFGAAGGMACGEYNTLKEHTLEDVLRRMKLRSAGILAGWTVLGACTGFAYYSGIELMKQARGKDDPVNHFALGFALSTPFTVFKGDPRLTISRGFTIGLLCALVKIVMSDENLKRKYDRRNYMGHCRLPDVYVAQEGMHRQIEMWRDKPYQK